MTQFKEGTRVFVIEETTDNDRGCLSTLGLHGTVRGYQWGMAKVYLDCGLKLLYFEHKLRSVPVATFKAGDPVDILPKNTTIWQPDYIYVGPHPTGQNGNYHICVHKPTGFSCACKEVRHPQPIELPKKEELALTSIEHPAIFTYGDRVEMKRVGETKWNKGFIYVGKHPQAPTPNGNSHIVVHADNMWSCACAEVQHVPVVWPPKKEVVYVPEAQSPVTSYRELRINPGESVTVTAKHAVPIELRDQVSAAASDARYFRAVRGYTQRRTDMLFRDLDNTLNGK